MPFTFVFKSTAASAISPKQVRGHLLAVLNKYEKLIRKDYEATVATWQHNISFRSERRYAGGDVSVMVSTSDEPYAWIDKGTPSRWAVMSTDWVSKTTPRFIGSGSGAGRKKIVGRSAMMKAGYTRPMPGIEARHFSTIIRSTHSKPFKKDVKEAVRKGLRKARSK